MNDDNPTGADHLLHLSSEIVAAYVMHNHVSAADLPGLITSTSAVLGRLARPVEVEEAAPTERQKPAVPISKSITPDYLISLEDGLKFKSLKRPLMVRYGLTPEQYREKWRLPADYPMVAPNYSVTRSALAKANGLGRERKADTAMLTEPAKPARKKLGLNFGTSAAST